MVTKVRLTSTKKTMTELYLSQTLALKQFVQLAAPLVVLIFTLIIQQTTRETNLREGDRCMCGDPCETGLPTAGASAAAGNNTTTAATANFEHSHPLWTGLGCNSDGGVACNLGLFVAVRACSFSVLVYLVAHNFNINQLKQLHFSFLSHAALVQFTFVSCFTFIFALKLKHNATYWMVDADYSSYLAWQEPHSCWRG
jgi:hypothetical protein